MADLFDSSVSKAASLAGRRIPVDGSTGTPEYTEPADIAALAADTNETFRISIAGSRVTLTGSAGTNSSFDLPNALTGISLDGTTLTITRRSGADIVLTLPSGGGDDGGGATLDAASLATLLQVLTATAVADDDEFAKVDADGNAEVSTWAAMKADARAGLPTADTDTTYGFALAGRVLTITDSAGGSMNIDLPDAFVAAAINGNVITLTRASGGTVRITIPSADGGGAQELTIAALGALLRTAADQASVDAADSFFFWDASASELKEVSFAQFRAALNIPAEGGGGSGAAPEQITGIPNGRVYQSRTAENAVTSIAQGSSGTTPFEVPLAEVDEFPGAAAGINHNSGRISFTNLHTDGDTQLLVNGAFRLFLRGTPAGVLRLFVRTYDSTGARVSEVADVEIASHSVGAQTALTAFSFPLDEVPVAFRRGRTYNVVGTFSAATAVTASNAAVGAAAGATGAHYLSVRRYRPAAHAANRDPRLSARPVIFGDDITLVRSTGSGDSTAFTNERLDDFLPFPLVDELPDAAAFTGHGVELTAHAGGRPPGRYITVANPEQLNRVEATIAPHPTNPNVWGFSQAAPPNGFGAVVEGGDFNGAFQSDHTNPLAIINDWIAEADAAANNFIYLEIRSPETSTVIQQPFARTGGTLTDAFGRDFRQYQSSGGISQAEDAALDNIRDETGENRVFIDYFTSDASGARGAPLNFKPARVWERLLSQEHLKPLVEQDEPIIEGRRLLSDFAVKPLYESLAAAEADGVLSRPGQQFGVQAVRGESVTNYVVRRGDPGTGGTRGAVSHRNRMRARLLQMSDGGGEYYSSEVRSLLRPFGNVTDVNRVDPNNYIGAASLFNAQPASAASVSVPIDPAFYSGAGAAITLRNRVGQGGVAVGQLQLPLTKVAGRTATFNRRSYQIYSTELTPAQTAGLHLGAWNFADEEIEYDLLDAIGGNPLNFNPDEVQFTAGAGYAAPQNAIAAAALEVGGGEGGGGSTASLVERALTSAAPWALANGEPSATTQVIDTYTIPASVAAAGGTIVQCSVAAAFILTQPNPFTAIGRAEARTMLVRVRGGQRTVLASDGAYIRSRNVGSFVRARSALSTAAMLRTGDVLQVEVLAFTETGSAANQLNLDTGANAVNRMTLLSFL